MEQSRHLLKSLSDAFPNFELKPDTVAVYERMLEDEPPELLAMAEKRLLATCRFFPTIAEIRGACADLLLGAVPTSAEAWGLVRRNIHGELTEEEKASAAFRLVNGAVRNLGNWYNLRQSDNQQVDRAHFWQVYKGMLEKERERLVLHPGLYAGEYLKLGAGNGEG